MKFKYTNRFMSRAAIMAIVALCMAPFGATADDFKIAGGGGLKNGSIYSAVIGDLAGVCSTEDLTLKEENTNGGPKNLELLLTNKVNAALVPTGLLFNAREENSASVANIKTLFAMHSEAIHFIVRSDVKIEGGMNLGKWIGNVGGDKITYNKAEDLKGRNVGAVGGSMVDGQTISNKLGYGWVMTPFGSTKDLLSALATGKVDAIVIQAGDKSPAVEAISGQFKLLPIRGNSDTEKIWNNAKVQYAKLNDGKAVDTLAAPALVVTRKWGSAEMNAKLATLVACYKANVGKLQDTTGTSPAWQSVSLEDQGKWPMYELPKAAATAPVVEQPKPVAKKK